MFSIVTCACNPGKPIQRSTAEQLLIQLQDSLSSDPANTYLIKNEGTDAIGWAAVLNNTPLAITEYNDSMVYLQQLTDRRWIKIDSLFVYDFIYGVTTDDLNNDGKTDLIVKGFPNMHGQSSSHVWLADDKGIWKRRPDLELFNIRYNKETGCVDSYYAGGARSLHYKETYKWAADTLQLVKRAEMDLQHDWHIYTRIFEYRDGQLVSMRLLEGENEVFDTAIFHEYY